MIGASDDDRNIRLLFLADAELIVDDNDVKALCYKLWYNVSIPTLLFALFLVLILW